MAWYNYTRRAHDIENSQPAKPNKSVSPIQCPICWHTRPMPHAHTVCLFFLHRLHSPFCIWANIENVDKQTNKQNREKKTHTKLEWKLEENFQITFEWIIWCIYLIFDRSWSSASSFPFSPFVFIVFALPGFRNMINSKCFVKAEYSKIFKVKIL